MSNDEQIQEVNFEEILKEIDHLLSLNMYSRVWSRLHRMNDAIQAGAWRSITPEQKARIDEISKELQELIPPLRKEIIDEFAQIFPDDTSTPKDGLDIYHLTNLLKRFKTLVDWRHDKRLINEFEERIQIISRWPELSILLGKFEQDIILLLGQEGNLNREGELSSSADKLLYNRKYEAIEYLKETDPPYFKNYFMEMLNKIIKDFITAPRVNEPFEPELRNIKSKWVRMYNKDDTLEFRRVSDLRLLMDTDQIRHDIQAIEDAFKANSMSPSKLEDLRYRLEVLRIQVDNKAGLEEDKKSIFLKKISLLSKRINETFATTKTQPQNFFFNKLNGSTSFILLVLVIVTVIPHLFGQNFFFIDKEWLYSLHPEMLGALITFALLTIVFEGIAKTQERSRLQYAYYKRLLKENDAQMRTEILCEMQDDGLLIGADLQNVDLDGVDCSGLNFSGANFSFIKNIEKGVYNKSTIFPNREKWSPTTNLAALTKPRRKFFQF